MVNLSLIEESLHSDSESIEEIKVTSVTDYLQKVQELIGEGMGGRVVYRGEPKVYPTRCLPNLFRNKYQYTHPSFEKNVIDKVRSEGLDNKKEYLLTAIEAQHGGFPSRLLDVTYNSLIALHFAVTPFYKEPNDKYDDEDGLVVLIKVENMYFPSSDQLEDFYYKELLNPDSMFNNYPIFSNHFKMLDFYSKNERIRAQQGGFILFCGKEYRPLPKYLTKSLIISKSDKSKIRNELFYLFNISNAYVYPEANNIVEPFIDATDIYSQSKKIDIKNELGEIFDRVKKQFDSYIMELISLVDIVKCDKEILELIKEMEGYLKSYYLDIAMSKNYFQSFTEEENTGFIKFEEKLDNYVLKKSSIIDYILCDKKINFSSLAQIRGEL
ncbi:FRG domain-containing protein [Psychrobacillus sp. NPDC093200]|uniref:FRG domain-containing protein n=1 Tax=Psychrobacillus sp. NPDC093200 TaxID=3390656 RepID=UPI003D00ABA9